MSRRKQAIVGSNAKHVLACGADEMPSPGKINIEAHSLQPVCKRARRSLARTLYGVSQDATCNETNREAVKNAAPLRQSCIDMASQVRHSNSPNPSTVPLEELCGISAHGHSLRERESGEAPLADDSSDGCSFYSCVEGHDQIDVPPLDPNTRSIL